MPETVPARRAMLVLAPLTLIAGCAQPNPTPPVPVVDVILPEQRDVPLFIEGTGQIAAIESVPLVARVQGYLQAIHYRDGAYVRKGAPLFTIEPAPFLAQVHQAQANLASAQAQAIYADHQASRYTQLAEADSTSRQQAEQTVSNRDAARAAIRQSSAALEQARITYGYTHVAAPFAGQVSAHLANVGALVGGSTPTTLASIVQLDPIWVNVNIPEQQAHQIDRQNAAMEAGLQGEQGYPRGGAIDYIAPTIDQQTGTLQIRGLFHNAQHTMLPGNFVRVRIAAGISHNALLVPDMALGDNQGERTLLVLDARGHVQQRKVATGARQDGMTVITAGLGARDRVVINGLQSVSPGQLVRAHLVSPAQAMAQEGLNP
ncbi:MAG: efflux RND transporter periplasmic adaptor subunit [Sphingomonadales bacterium]|nr:efflux RND transporter periplasmic adaptor subunit [Sphingomonadales bacterium]MDE2172166.1 efflux RND transporter periplasmic adaptor subunit [Sphingomonadales bacterium]